MTLVHNWPRVLLRASSLWPVYLSLFLDLAVEMVPYLADWLPWWVPIVILVLTPFFRIIRQERLHADQSDKE